MTELQQNRYDRLLRRVGGLIGAKSMVNDALGELFPVIDVENVPGELLALQPTQIGMCSSILQPLAANFNHHQLFNPVDSQVVITITSVVMFPFQITTFHFSTFFPILTNLVGNERRRDTRSGILANLVAQNRNEQSLASGGLDMRFRVLTNETLVFSDENDVAVLFPGTGFTVSSGAVNVTTTVGFFWRERVFEESEAIPNG